MSEHDHSDFLKVDTPANACTLSDRKLREAFRASMDATEEKVGMLDQLTARIASMKNEQKAVKPSQDDKPSAAREDEPKAAEPEVTAIKEEASEPPKTTGTEAPVIEDAPQDEEGELFAHLNEIMAQKSNEMPELSPEPGLADSKSVIVRTFASLMPKKKAKPATVVVAQAPVPAAPKPEKTESGSIVVGLVKRLIPTKKAKSASATVTEAAPIMEPAPAAKAPAKSVIVRMVSGLKPKPKAKPAQSTGLRKDQSGSIVIGILKAISPIKRSA